MTTLENNLKRLGYEVSHFPTKEEAAAYLNRVIDGTTVGCGGSMTLMEMGLLDTLSTHNILYYHGAAKDGITPGEMQKLASGAAIYLSSVNGLSEGGEIVNIDGHCNRVASTLWGHQKVYFVVGKNKIAPDLESAIHRARNVAAPKNAKRLGRNTPCSKHADRCYDCQSPERICRALSVLWTKPSSSPYEVVLIDEPLGY